MIALLNIVLFYNLWSMMMSNQIFAGTSYIAWWSKYVFGNTKSNKLLSNTRNFSFVQKFIQIFITYNASVRNKNKKNILLLWKIKFSQIIIKAEQNTSWN